MWNNWGWETLRRFSSSGQTRCEFRHGLDQWWWSWSVWLDWQNWHHRGLVGFFVSIWYFMSAHCRRAAECPAALSATCPAWVSDELAALDRSSQKVLVHDVSRLSSNPAHNLLTLGLCVCRIRPCFLWHYFIHVCSYLLMVAVTLKLLKYVWHT